MLVSFSLVLQKLEIRVTCIFELSNNWYVIVFDYCHLLTLRRLQDVYPSYINKILSFHCQKINIRKLGCLWRVLRASHPCGTLHPGQCPMSVSTYLVICIIHWLFSRLVPSSLDGRRHYVHSNFNVLLNYFYFLMFTFLVWSLFTSVSSTFQF